MNQENDKRKAENVMREALERLGYTVEGIYILDYDTATATHDTDEKKEKNMFLLLDFIYRTESKKQRILILQELVAESERQYDAQTGIDTEADRHNEFGQAARYRRTTELIGFWAKVHLNTTNDLSEQVLTIIESTPLMFEDWVKIYAQGRGGKLTMLAERQMKEAEVSFERLIYFEAQLHCDDINPFIRDTKDLLAKMIREFNQPFEEWRKLWDRQTILGTRMNDHVRDIIFAKMISPEGAQTFSDWKYLWQQITDARNQRSIQNGLAYVGRLVLGKLEETATAFHELHLVVDYARQESQENYGAIVKRAIERMTGMAETFPQWNVIRLKAPDQKTRKLAEKEMMKLLKPGEGKNNVKPSKNQSS
jgi:hypothetical protein